MKFLISLSIMLGIAAMTGCAQSPLSPKGDAIFYALQADSMMNTWRYECSTVSSRAEFEADVARAEWWRRNKETVQAADYGLGYNVLAISDDRVSTGARMAMGMTLEIQQRSEALVNEKLNNTSDKEALCIKVLGQYREGTWDIKGPEEMEDLLMKMKQESNNNQEALEVRRGMIEKATGVSYGRSLYVVEKMAAKDDSCPTPIAQMVKGEWPIEIYSVDCPNESLLLMRCEWGNCRPLE